MQFLKSRAKHMQGFPSQYQLRSGNLFALHKQWLLWQYAGNNTALNVAWLLRGHQPVVTFDTDGAAASGASEAAGRGRGGCPCEPPCPAEPCCCCCCCPPPSLSFSLKPPPPPVFPVREDIQDAVGVTAVTLGQTAAACAVLLQDHGVVRYWPRTLHAKGTDIVGIVTCCKVACKSRQPYAMTLYFMPPLALLSYVYHIAFFAIL